MWANYDSVLSQLRGAGLIVEDLRPGKMMRCKVEGEREHRGWYSLHELFIKSGETILVGSYGVWRGTDNGVQKIALGKDHALSPEQRKALDQRRRDDMARAEAERKEVALKASRAASFMWARLTEDGDCDYLKRKGVGAYDVRFSSKGTMAISMQDTAGTVHGLQLIRSAAEVKKGLREKDFWPFGASTKGHFHPIGVPTNVVLVAEGYATAASLRAATELPVVVAFNAGNIGPVCEALHKKNKLLHFLICADDDVWQKCGAKVDGKLCKAPVNVRRDPLICPTCKQFHGKINAGVDTASAVALAMRGAWVAPVFQDEETREDRFRRLGRKITDFNDLHAIEGLGRVRAVIEAKLLELGWTPKAPKAPTTQSGGGGRAPLQRVTDLEEMLERYSLVYASQGAVFDFEEHKLLALSDMRDFIGHREISKAWLEHPERRQVRANEVGFDPTGLDQQVICNLWAGWPTTPKEGSCERLLHMLRHVCSGEKKREEIFQWVLKWLAYPIQNPGAKMKSTVVLHGPQGVGKNFFFEVVMGLYGEYGRIIDQNAIEDKFNDWASRALFLIADEVIARSEVYHVKNKLKSFITGKKIRINPKNMAAYDESNHANIVFLSNELMPVVIEEDDRRHCIIWTPAKLEKSFYTEAMNELRGGGAAALHHYLLKLPLGDFMPDTEPPMSEAKRSLIEDSLDSTSRFFHELERGEILESYKLGPALSQDIFDLYVHWCGRKGLRHAPMPKLIRVMSKRHGCDDGRARYMVYSDSDQVPPEERGPHGYLVLGDREQPMNVPDKEWLGDCFAGFRKAAQACKGRSNG